MGEELKHAIDLGQRWAYAPAKRHVDGDSEEVGGTGEDGFAIFAEDAPEDGSFAWTPYEGSAQALVVQHNDLYDEWEDLRYSEARERAERLETIGRRLAAAYAAEEEEWGFPFNFELRAAHRELLATLATDQQAAEAGGEEEGELRPQECQDCDCQQHRWNARSCALRTDPPSTCVCDHPTSHHRFA